MAINKEDLRIGNLVSDVYSENGIWKIRSLSEKKAKYGNSNLCVFTSSYEYLKPILITPDILLKLGFISNPYQDRYELDDIYVEFCAIKNICWIEGKPHIQFVNQLQNLFYFSNNKELQLKK